MLMPKKLYFYLFSPGIGFSILSVKRMYYSDILFKTQSNCVCAGVCVCVCRYYMVQTHLNHLRTSQTYTYTKAHARSV